MKQSYGLLFALLGCAVVVFLADSFYLNYESIMAQLYAIDLRPAGATNGWHITESSPLFLIGFAQLLAYLYDVYAGVAWYGVLMQGLLVAAVWGFVAWGASCGRQQAGGFLWRVVLWGLLGFIVFLYPLMFAYHTQRAYWLCAVGLGLLPGELWAAGSAAGNRQSRCSLWLTLLGVLLFLAGAWVRFEVAGIVLLMGMAFAGCFMGWRGMAKLWPALLVFGATLCYVEAENSKPFFYRQIEPDGEYEILQRRSARLPAPATATDSLRFNMLTNWMLEDTGLITIGYVKGQITQGRHTYDHRLMEYWRTARQEMLNNVRTAWPYALAAAALLLLCLWKWPWRTLLFSIAYSALLIFIAGRGVLSERHMIPLLGMVVLYTSVQLAGHARGKERWWLAGVLLAAALAVAGEVYQKAKQQQIRTAQQQTVLQQMHQWSKQTMVAMDGPYQECFPYRAGVHDTFVNRYLYLSLMQMSHTEKHQRYITQRLQCQALNLGSVYTAFVKKYPQHVYISSPRRVAVLEQVLRQHYGLPLKFIHVKDLLPQYEPESLRPAAYHIAWQP